MARPPSDARPQLSVFDRLLDDNPKNQQPEVPPTRHQAVRLYKDAVGRDHCVQTYSDHGSGS